MTDPVKHVAPGDIPDELKDKPWAHDMYRKLKAKDDAAKASKADPETYIEEQDMCTETITRKMRGRPVTHDEAEISAQRLINSHFHNADQARVSIPARPDNDDVLVMDYIEEQRANETALSHIRAYASEAARTPIDRDTILGCWDVEQLRMYALTLREESTGLIRLIETYRFKEQK
jgi:hypothetical protein